MEASANNCACLHHPPVPCSPSQVVARCGRITDQWGEPVPEWIDTAELVLQAGLEQVRGSSLLSAGQGRSQCREMQQCCHCLRCHCITATVDAPSSPLLQPQFPESPYLHILYSSFLIEARKQYQVGSCQGLLVSQLST